MCALSPAPHSHCPDSRPTQPLGFPEGPRLFPTERPLLVLPLLRCLLLSSLRPSPQAAPSTHRLPCLCLASGGRSPSLCPRTFQIKGSPLRSPKCLCTFPVSCHPGSSLRAGVCCPTLGISPAPRRNLLLYLPVESTNQFGAIQTGKLFLNH